MDRAYPLLFSTKVLHLINFLLCDPSKNLHRRGFGLQVPLLCEPLEDPTESHHTRGLVQRDHEDIPEPLSSKSIKILSFPNSKTIQLYSCVLIGKFVIWNLFGDIVGFYI